VQRKCSESFHERLCGSTFRLKKNRLSDEGYFCGRREKNERRDGKYLTFIIVFLGFSRLILLASILLLIVDANISKFKEPFFVIRRMAEKFVKYNKKNKKSFQMNFFILFKLISTTG